MHLVSRQGCVQCPATLPTCSCASNQRCDLTSQTCSACAQPVCVDVGPAPAAKGPNGGVIAGVVIAILMVIALLAGVIYYRRRRATNAAAALKRATTEFKPDVVASAETVLNRPDPTEKPPVPSLREEASIRVYDDNSSINLDPANRPENPFSDHASIATASDRATNVIPIAYLPPSSASIAPSESTSVPTARTPASIATTLTIDTISEESRSQPGTPMRPQRGPEIDMRLDLSRPASEAPSSFLLPPNTPYTSSTRSGVSGVSSRASVLSTTSSFLNEAPQIVTPLKGNFRQVLGVHKAEVVQLGATPSSPSLSVNTSRATYGTSMRSPLSQNAYSAEDAAKQSQAGTLNPFADRFARPDTADSSTSTSTFGTPSGSSRMVTPVDWNSDSRPTSMLSQAGTITADISNATIVRMTKPVAHTSAGSSPSNSSPNTPRTADFRSAGQLSPPAQRVPRSFDDLMDPRMSQASMATTNRTSTADSILEAFPFVPPSPISMHHNHSQPPTPLSQRSFQQQQHPHDSQHLSVAPGRFTLGMSVMSTSSSGLGAFPFQFEEPPTPQTADSNAANTASGGSSRASLDTLELSRDLSAFPLPSDSPTSSKAPETS